MHRFTLLRYLYLFIVLHLLSRGDFGGPISAALLPCRAVVLPPTCANAGTPSPLPPSPRTFFTHLAPVLDADRLSNACRLPPLEAGLWELGQTVAIRLCLGHAQERRAQACSRSSRPAGATRPGAQKAKGRCPTPIQSRRDTQCLRCSRPRARQWCIAWRLRLGRWPRPRRRSCRVRMASPHLKLPTLSSPAEGTPRLERP